MLWLWILAALAAYYIKGLCGFANTLVFTSILGFGSANIEISPVELILGLPANVFMTLKNRKKLNPRVYVPLAVLVMLGAVPGAFLLKNLNAGYIKIIFGAVVILLGVEMLLREVKVLKFRESKLVLALIGIISGVMCGLFGVGALLAAYIGRVTGTSEEFKANINAVFIVENSFRVILYAVMGIITLESLKMAALLLPFMAAGLFLGMLSAKRMDEKLVKRFIVVLLIISGVIMILKNV